MLSTGTFCPVIAFRRPCPTLWASRSYPERSTLLQLQNWVRHGRGRRPPALICNYCSSLGPGPGYTPRLQTTSACMLILHSSESWFAFDCGCRLLQKMWPAHSATRLQTAWATTPGLALAVAIAPRDIIACALSWPPELKLVGWTLSSKRRACSHHVWILQVLLKMVCKPTVVVAGGRPTSGLETGGRMARPLSTWRSPLACDKGLWLPQQQQGPVLQKITKPASGLICRRRLPVLMRVSNSSPWSPRLPAEVGHRWPCKPGGNLRTAWPRALVKRPALSLASCCKLWQSAFSVKTRELSSGAWAGLKPAPRPWPILDEAACAWSGQCKWFAADTCSLRQPVVWVGLSAAWWGRYIWAFQRTLAPGPVSQYASHLFWLWQSHFWPAFLFRVSIGPGTCGLTRTVTYMLFCFIFLHLHHGAWTFSPSRIDDCSYYWSSLIIVFPFSVAALHKLHSWL